MKQAHIESLPVEWITFPGQPAAIFPGMIAPPHRPWQCARQRNQELAPQNKKSPAARRPPGGMETSELAKALLLYLMSSPKEMSSLAGSTSSRSLFDGLLPI